MQARTRSMSIRLTEKEFQTVWDRALESGMSQSQYVRSAALNQTGTQIGNQREIMKELCSMLSILNRMEHSDEKDQLLEEVQQICQFLK